MRMSPTDSKIEFIKKQIGAAIQQAEQSKVTPGVCTEHGHMIDCQITNMRLSEMVLDSNVELSEQITSLTTSVGDITRNMNVVKIEKHDDDDKTLDWRLLAFQVIKRAPWAAAIVVLVGGFIFAKIKGWL